MSDTPDRPEFDLDDETLRRARSVKWTYPGPEVLPAWVAELDVAVCPPVATALHRAIENGSIGYPPPDRDTGLPEATAAFQQRRFGWPVDPARVVATGDVMAGIMLALWALCEPGPVVVPVPTYPPFLAAVPWTGHELVAVPMHEPTGTHRWSLDLDRIDAALAAGARTVLIANPHNPTGRAFSRAELEGLRDVVRQHGARVISDEIHAPLVLPGAVHMPYLSLAGTADHAVAVVAASKAFNTAGLRCAQLVVPDPRTRALLDEEPDARNDSWSPLGAIAAATAYRDGDPWLASLVERLDQQRTLLGELLAAYVPLVRMRPLEATYLAWLDVRAYGHEDPAAVADEHGRVRLAPGHHYAPGLGGHVRLNVATGPERLTKIVQRLARAWT